jgi:hypothetical protein
VSRSQARTIDVSRASTSAAPGATSTPERYAMLRTDPPSARRRGPPGHRRAMPLCRVGRAHAARPSTRSRS